MTKLAKWLVLLGLVFGFASTSALADRLKDMTSIAGVRSNQLVGYGVVVGLAGTGDGSSGLTLQSLQSMVSQFGLVTDAANLNAKNVASVMVTAEMPAFMKPGQRLDVTVSTIGGSKSLRGGTLLMTPMLGADGEVLYVGKAKNLKKRVASYFLRASGSARIESMVDQIHDIAINVTDTENQALLLDSSLIKISSRP